MLCLAAGLAFVGCSAPKAVELDSGANITLNHNLIQKRHFGIQKDEFLRYNNWVYNIVLYKNADDLIPNEKIVKTFYLAHNADRIIIIGDKNLAYEYRNYFFANEVKAKIEASGVYDYSIFLDEKTGVLFAVQKCKGDEGSQDLGADEIIKKWWHYMADIMETNEDESPVSEPLKEVFYME